MYRDTFKANIRREIKDYCPTLAGRIKFDLYEFPQCCGMLVLKKISWVADPNNAYIGWYESHHENALEDIVDEDVKKFTDILIKHCRDAKFARVITNVGPKQHASYRLMSDPRWKMVDSWSNPYNGYTTVKTWMLSVS